MDNATRRNFESWLRRQIFGCEEEIGPCTKLIVKHLSPTGKGGNEIATIKLDAPKEDDLDSIIAETESVCLEDAEGIGGIQKYHIGPYFKGSGKVVGRFVLRIEAAEDDESVESEPATSSGLLAQLMRHNEALQRTTVAAVGNIVAMQSRIIGRLSEQNENLQSKQMEVMETLEGLRSQQHERDMQSRVAEHKQKMVEEVAGTVKMLMPAIVNKFNPTGKKLLPEKASPVEVQIASVLETLTPAQMEEMQKVLTPQQIIGLMSVYQSTREKFEPDSKDNEKKD